MTFENRKALGGFLRAMRARTKPQDVGLPFLAGRRVPGLRRAEVAELTGISTDYYTRMESGRAGEVSAGVLTALAAALRLSAPEAAYLRTLAISPGSQPVRDAVALDTDLRMLLETIRVPAYATDRRPHVLAANLPEQPDPNTSNVRGHGTRPRFVTAGVVEAARRGGDR
jgi:transcriptional regulator with XRE-family HTH domain